MRNQLITSDSVTTISITQSKSNCVTTEVILTLVLLLVVVVLSILQIIITLI